MNYSILNKAKSFLIYLRFELSHLKILDAFWIDAALRPTSKAVGKRCSLRDDKSSHTRHQLPLRKKPVCDIISRAIWIVLLFSCWFCQRHWRLKKSKNWLTGSKQKPVGFHHLIAEPVCVCEPLEEPGWKNMNTSFTDNTGDCWCPEAT